MQSRSFREPLMMLEGADYTAFDRFHFARGEAPQYLQREFGINVEGHDGRALNIGRVLRENVQFVDSRADDGSPGC